MIRVIGSVVFLALFVLPSKAQLSAVPVPAFGYTYQDFVPGGFTILDTLEGDLNRDGRKDRVMIVEIDVEKFSEIEADSFGIDNRQLLILFNEGAGYRLAARSSEAVLCLGCGGIFGDPYAGMSIAKNVLTVSHYGGSAWRWGYEHKYRLQNGRFYLIGKTHLSFWALAFCDELKDHGHKKYEDINLLTGQHYKEEISPECKKTTHWDKIQLAPLKRIDEDIFEFDED